MKWLHPSEEELQQYALNEKGNDSIVMDHISFCEKCQAMVTNYRLILTAVEQEPKPFFDFDTTELVLTRLETPVTKIVTSKFQQYIRMAAIAFVISALFFFRKFFVNVAGGVSMAVLLIISVASLTIVVYRAADMYKKYRKLTNQLNFH